MAPANSPKILRQSKIAAASGWIGSALEYYDFFIYATAASLIFPQIFFSSQHPTAAIIASLATYGVGYVARPIGAFVLGHWGDTHGRKKRPFGLPICDGLLDIAGRSAPDL
jgi:MFS family permease